MTKQHADSEPGQPLGLPLNDGLGAAADAHCRCRRCIAERGDTVNGLPRLLAEMIVCPTCGDKRCLHAYNHAAPCANVELFAHNAWVEQMALRTEPASGNEMQQIDAVIALGSLEAPNAELTGPL